MITTIRNLATVEYKSLNSKFIGYAYPLASISDFKNYLSQLRKEHPKANHICYAYRFGFDNEYVRSSDDGEPSGTAGKPILNQLLSFQIKNCAIFVVRYFGGTKLGVAGLIDAYKETAKLCLEKADLYEAEEMESLKIRLKNEEYYTAIKKFKSNNIDIVNSSFEVNECVLEIVLPKSKKTMILGELNYEILGAK